MFNLKNAVNECDFCQKELKNVYFIYSEHDAKNPVECCKSCLTRRKDLTIVKNKKIYWRQ